MMTGCHKTCTPGIIPGMYDMFYNSKKYNKQNSPHRNSKIQLYYFEFAGLCTYDSSIEQYFKLQNKRMNSGDNAFTRTAKSTLYNTTNKEYGSVWVQNNQRPELTNIKKDIIPTYNEIVTSLNDYRRAEKLIKSKVIRETLQRDGIDPHSQNNRFQKTTQFHVSKGYSEYPKHGLNVGNPMYHTNNMNYGNSRPADFEIQEKYFPCNSNFTKTFNGGTFKFNGLNTVKTVSSVHNNLNDM